MILLCGYLIWSYFKLNSPMPNEPKHETTSHQIISMNDIMKIDCDKYTVNDWRNYDDFFNHRPVVYIGISPMESNGN